MAVLKATTALSNARTIYQSSTHDLGCIMVDASLTSLDDTGLFSDKSEWTFAMISPFAKIKSSVYELIKNTAATSKKYRENIDIHRKEMGVTGLPFDQKKKDKLDTRTLIVRLSSHSTKTRSSRY